MLHPAQQPVEQLLAECDVERTRRSGPGGQHRNKVETAVVVAHRPTGIRAEANERRSQELNRQTAIHRLRIRLAVQVRSDARGEISQLWRSRTRDGKILINIAHEDFPVLLAEALDAITAAEFDLAVAASELGVSSSQLVKFLKLEPTALTLVNHQRRLRGQTAYR